MQGAACPCPVAEDGDGWGNKVGPGTPYPLPATGGCYAGAAHSPHYADPLSAGRAASPGCGSVGAHIGFHRNVECVGGSIRPPGQRLYADLRTPRANRRGFLHPNTYPDTPTVIPANPAGAGVIPRRACSSNIRGKSSAAGTPTPIGPGPRERAYAGAGGWRNPNRGAPYCHTQAYPRACAHAHPRRAYSALSGPAASGYAHEGAKHGAKANAHVAAD